MNISPISESQAQPTEEVGRHLALVSGVNNSIRSNALSSLKYAESDASKMAEVLLDRCAFQLSPSPLLGAHARSSDLKQAILELAGEERTNQDVLLFYFSGHGQPLSLRGRKELYLVTYDFNEREAQRDPYLHISLSWLWENLYQYQAAGSVIIILDCCYSGNMVDAAPDPLQLDLRRAIEDSLDSVIVSGEGLKDRLRVVLTASGYNQAALETAEQGLMSGLIMKALHGEDASALDRDGNVSVKSLHDFLERQYKLRGQIQTPYLLGHITRTCILARYPEHAQQEQEQREREEWQRLLTQERELRLRAMLANHTIFVNDRLTSFVGRNQELAEIRQRIAERIETGGYVTITGQAGQGKSSIIAKLVAEVGLDQVAHHFIPFNPGPDHQVSLLRNLMSRLILKYDLSDIYVTDASRTTLRDFFPKVLDEVVTRGGQEVVYIDGLDQLLEDENGERDLSFLPASLPTGIVCVLGTRPNDTLKPLELLKPHYEYRLAPLSRSDFDLILTHRGVSLGADITDRFHAAMHANALYLDLLAKHLAGMQTIDVESIIIQLTDNPDNIFSLTIDRLRRQHQHWDEVIKPVLGLLLATQRSLGQRAIRDLIGIDGDKLREGLQKLGGLVIQDGRSRYDFFHLKLRDYLRQDKQRPSKIHVFDEDEEQIWHMRLANWCESGPGGLSTIWQNISQDAFEEERRDYAREHYIAHLYHAHDWPRLWKVLDGGSYGRAKLRYDPSTRTYARDLEYGCQAATSDEHSTAEQLALLPRLWRYVLLRCTLASRARYYPDELFTLLVLKQRDNEAQELVEFLPTPESRAMALCRIAEALAYDTERRQKALTIFQQAVGVANTIRDKWEHARVFRALAVTLAEVELWDIAIEAANSIGDLRDRVETLAIIFQETIAAGEREKGEMLLQEFSRYAQLTRHFLDYEPTLYALKEVLERPSEWQIVIRDIWKIHSSNQRAKHLAAISNAFVGLGKYESAKSIAYMTKDRHFELKVLISIARRFVSLRDKSSTMKVIEEILEMKKYVAQGEDVDTISVLALLFAASGERERAISILMRSTQINQTVDNVIDRARALIDFAADIGTLINQATARRVLLEAVTVVHGIKDYQERAKTLKKVADTMTQIGDEVTAVKIYIEAGYAPLAIFGDLEASVAILMSQGIYGQSSAIGLMGKERFLEDLLQKRKWNKAIEWARNKDLNKSKDKEPRFALRSVYTLVIIRTMHRMGEQNRARSLLNEALEVAYRIKDKKEKISTLVSIVEAAGDLEVLNIVVKLSGEILNDIKYFIDIREKFEILCQIAAALYKVRQEAFANSITEDLTRMVPGPEEPMLRIEALKKIANVLAYKHDPVTLIKFVQDSWSNTTKLEVALQLLPITSGLFIRHPNTIDTFIQSFTWTDDILKVSVV